MFITLFNSGIYNPLYNGLVFLIGVVPMADVGIAVIILTIFVKLLLFPLAQKVSLTQVVIKKMQPELEKLKEKFKEDKPEQTRKILALYKEHNINPMFGFLVILIQLPIILGLYWVFYKGGLPGIDTSLLYSFVNEPSSVEMLFIGLVDMGSKSVVLAALAGITQFINMQIVMPTKPKPKNADKPSLKDDLARSMHMQMKYLMPIIITVVAYTISSAVALYWVTSNVFSIGQELLVRRNIKNKE
ncbi:MAG: YidC/Oxa1 family membrane protein insertase [Candidatus Pacebacteria bacterium]|nr:YidC/Oxa1 family membrane protein insertase [Candidatus Paceibacterota bacterium]